MTTERLEEIIRSYCPEIIKGSTEWCNVLGAMIYAVDDALDEAADKIQYSASHLKERILDLKIKD